MSTSHRRERRIGTFALASRTRRVAFAAGLIGLSIIGGPNSGSADDSISVDDLGRLEWTHDRYLAAGLPFPEVDIEFHHDDAPCEGNMGTLRRQEDGSRIVRVCADHHDPAIRDSWRRKTIVHELAHVWEARHLSDEVRAEFMQLRGLDHWNDRTEPWHDRAIEHAAEVITWGIGDPAWRFATLPDSACEQMAEAYELLTGTTAPRVRAEPCPTDGSDSDVLLARSSRTGATLSGDDAS